MKSFKFILILIFIWGCHSGKEILRVSFYNKPASLIWNENKDINLCSKKTKNEVVIYNGIIKPQIVENLYNKGVDVLTLSKECEVDAVLIDYNDLINISPNTLENYSKKYNIVSANIYDNKSTKYFLKKLIKKDINQKTILLTSVIANLSQPLSQSHINGYHIENPIYELNKILFNEKATLKIVVINRYGDKTDNFKDEKKLFSNFISKLDKKPDIIISDIPKEMTIDGVWITKSENAFISIYKKLAFLNEIKRKEIKPEVENTSKTPLTNEIITKTKEYFNKEIAFSKIEINKEKILLYLAKSIKKRVKSDFAVICDKTIKDGIKKGKIKIKDIYSVINDYNEKTVYLKIRAEKMNDFFFDILKINFVVYDKKELKEDDIKKIRFTNSKVYRVLINENCIKNNKSLFNHVAEFSVINVNLCENLIWYLRNYGIKDEDN